jgi:hypothetical protein
MTHIIYEIFPVTLIAQQPVLLRAYHTQEYQPWMVLHQPGSHPNEVIIHHLMATFGDAIDMQRTIVHSTSWRYDVTWDQIILTYLVVLPQHTWHTQHGMAGTIPQVCFEPIGAIRMRHGQHHRAPEQLAPAEVLAHALDHLAALSSYDPAIQAVLEPEWQAILRARGPQPAGCLQRVSPRQLTIEAGWPSHRPSLSSAVLANCGETLPTRTEASAHIAR